MYNDIINQVVFLNSESVSGTNALKFLDESEDFTFFPLAMSLVRMSTP